MLINSLFTEKGAVKAFMTVPSPAAVDNGTTDCVQPTHVLSQWFAILTLVPLLLEIVLLLITGQLEHFLWLAEQAATTLLLSWPVAIPLFIWWVIGHDRCVERDELHSLRLLWLTPQIVLPITMLVFGAVFASDVLLPSNRWQVTVVHCLYLVSMVLSLSAIFQNRNRQSFVAPLSLFSMLNSTVCAFTASCSVSGDWL
ncbi:MAG TPA: hypothetical protein DDZ90_07640 [Planctomycetaceae bacterium]|nr:hypothetical protein [Gimesia sp.]HBL43251.1 hypothetical protein [Planctomycetaceae bacterium]|tara:strand:+ start:1577 stop:2173 length:597 start_codon:yes stop_codon:yes gene_type:complete